MMNLIDKTGFNQNVLAFTGRKLTVHTGDEVFELLQDDEFKANWNSLYQLCPWATVFQSRAFVATWYRVYQKSYLPVMVTCTEGNTLTGLLTIAKGKDGLIIGAGANQAEYQVWLAPATDEGAFIKNALIEIVRLFPKDSIQFKYIPSNTPLKWATQDPEWTKHCVVQAFQQPLLKIDDEKISKELRKKNRREKVNRLKRMGDVKFEHITDYKIFTSIIDQLIAQYDFRQGARFNKNFFQSDSSRRTFLLQLYEHGLLHATVLKLNNEIIASNVGVIGKQWLHLQGLNTHAPAFAKYSPGILHFLMLARQLASEQIEVFDLTPGKDAYKEELATDFTNVYELSIGSAYVSLTKGLKLELLDALKNNLLKIGVKQSDLKKFKTSISVLKDKINNFKAQGFFNSIRSISKQVQESGKARIYFIQVNTFFDPLVKKLPLHYDSLVDLLEFEGKGTWMTRWEFLQDAIRRFEVGQHCYSFREEGPLLGCVWTSIADSNAADGGELLLQGFYCHPAGRSQLEAFLTAVTASVVSNQKEGKLYAATHGKTNNFNPALEAIGFKHTEQ